MNSVKQEFQKRIIEINTYLEYLDKITTSQLVDEINKILKANYYMLVYNLVESTISNSLNLFQEILKEENIKFKDLNYSLQENFIKCHANEINKLNNENTINKIKYLSKIFTEEKNIDFSFIGYVNGNVDQKKIEEICKNIGFDFQAKGQEDSWVIFETLLYTRDILAHGNISFAEYGKDKTITDLRRLNKIIEYMEHFVEEFSKYINDRKYLR